MKSVYFDCSFGISGDMAVAALLDLGADRGALLDTLETLPLSGYKIEISEVEKSGINAFDFNVILDQENHDHDMPYLHGSSSEHSHEDSIPHEHHSHKSSGLSHHEHRNLTTIKEILDSSSMSPGAKDLANRIFEILAVAEAEAHKQPKDQVHFHEVGAVDSIVDIAAFSICMDELGYDQVFVPRLCDGCGQIRCQHGLIPVPVPAVKNVAKNHQLPLVSTNVQGELVTPTGAAIVAATMTNRNLPSPYYIQKVGTGAGKREYETPGIFQIMVITY